MTLSCASGHLVIFETSHAINQLLLSADVPSLLGEGRSSLIGYCIYRLSLSTLIFISKDMHLFLARLQPTICFWLVKIKQQVQVFNINLFVKLEFIGFYYKTIPSSFRKTDSTIDQPSRFWFSLASIILLNLLIFLYIQFNYRQPHPISVGSTTIFVGP